ncbi:MAG: S-layer homology domain-containing protein [Clostridia bacterium]|nr:S-layer homology domain-containing protein [Clostridia bacterium]
MKKRFKGLICLWLALIMVMSTPVIAAAQATVYLLVNVDENNYFSFDYLNNSDQSYPLVLGKALTEQDDIMTAVNSAAPSDHELSGWNLWHGFLQSGGIPIINYNGAKNLAADASVSESDYSDAAAYPGYYIIALEPIYSPSEDIEKGTGLARITRCTVRFETNGGSEIKDKIVVRGSKVERPDDPTKEGYSFDGWYRDTRLKKAYDFDKVVERPITLYAKWNEVGAANADSNLDVTVDDNDTVNPFEYIDSIDKLEKDLTRAEATDIFFKLLDKETRENNLTHENAFEDTDPSAWYNTSVSTMAKLEIVKGRSQTIFAPNEPITRGEFAVICARFDNSEFMVKDSFTDIDDHWAESEIYKASALGWIDGYADNTFRPDEFISHKEARAMITKALELMKSAASGK